MLRDMPANRTHGPDRYTTVAIVLHWLIALLVVAQFGLGWGMQEIGKNPPGPRAEAFNLHKSLGLTIFALMALRLAWRARHPAPALPPMPGWQAVLAKCTHALLYVALVAMPLAGYLGSEFSGYPVRFFGLTLPGWASARPDVKELMSALHLGLSWALAAAVATHLAGVAKHIFIDRDNLLGRMGVGRV
jgi:cytochrome b561